MTATTAGPEPVIGEPATRQKLLVTTKPLFSAIFDSLVDPAYVLGLLRCLEVAAGLTLLGLTARLTAVLDSSPGTVDLLTTDANNGTFFIDISNATDTNIAGLVTGIVTPFTHATVSSWNELVGEGSSVYAHSVAVVLTQTVNIGLWLATAIWFTVKYDDWDCTNPGKLLEQYNATDTTTNGLTLYNQLAFTFYNGSTNEPLTSILGMEDTTLFTEGINALYDAFGTDMVTLSLLDTTNITVSQQIVSKLSKDCSLKKGAMGVSWAGFTLFVLSTVVLFIAYLTNPAQPPKSMVPFTTFKASFARETGATAPSKVEALKAREFKITESPEGIDLESMITEPKESMKHVEVTVVHVEQLNNTHIYNFLVHLTFPNFPKYSIDVEYKAPIEQTGSSPATSEVLSLKSSIVADGDAFVASTAPGISIKSQCEVCLWKDEKKLVQDALRKEYNVAAGADDVKFNEDFEKSWSAIVTYVMSRDNGFGDLNNIKDVVTAIHGRAGGTTSKDDLKQFSKDVWKGQVTSSNDPQRDPKKATSVIDSIRTWRGILLLPGWLIVILLELLGEFIGWLAKKLRLISVWIFFLGDPVVRGPVLSPSSLGHVSEISKIFLGLEIGVPTTEGTSTTTVFGVSVVCDPKPDAVVSPSIVGLRRLLVSGVAAHDQLTTQSEVQKYKRKKLAASRGFSRAMMF